MARFLQLYGSRTQSGEDISYDVTMTIEAKKMSHLEPQEIHPETPSLRGSMCCFRHSYNVCIHKKSMITVEIGKRSYLYTM